MRKKLAVVVGSLFAIALGAGAIGVPAAASVHLGITLASDMSPKFVTADFVSD